jgi:hypothetical protein
VDVPGLQNIRGGEVLLLRGVGFLSWRRDAEVATFILVKETAEDRRRIEVGPRKGSAGYFIKLVESSRAGWEFSDAATELTST